MPLTFISDDITKLNVDIIVNPTNTQLQCHGGGVSGAIFRAAGQEQMQAACDRIGGCPVSEAVITEGFALTAKYVIHTVGPRYSPEKLEQRGDLYWCYKNALTLAWDYGRSIAFPLISTGKRGYPWREALDIAVEAIVWFLGKYGDNLDVKLCLMEPEMFPVAQELKDKHERAVSAYAKGYHSEMAGMQFKWVPIKFYPEDEAKMATMNHEEKMAYLQWLKEEHRYVELDEE